MVRKQIKILIMEDDPDDRVLIREALTDARSAIFDFQMEYADRLSSGLKRLSEGGIDLVLLDLGLPDSQDYEALDF